MTHKFKLSRRIARLKAAAAAVLVPQVFAAPLLIGVAAGCSDNGIESPTAVNHPGDLVDFRQTRGKHAKVTLASLSVSPDSAKLLPGQHEQYSAAAVMSDGTSGTVAVVWSATGGTIDSTGLFTAGDSLGRFRVVAKQSSGTVSDTAQLAVASGTAVPQSVSLTPASDTVATGGTATFAAVVTMSDGTTGTAPVTFTSTGGSITSSGVYTAGNVAGSYAVVATAGAGGPADTAAVTVTATTTSCTGTATTICPGDDLQAKVLAAGTGAVFTIKAGVHRLQTITPKSGQQFIGETGAILSGAKLLTTWTPNGATWYATGQTQEFNHATGQCASGTACLYPEDVYRDDVLLHRQLSLSAVGPGDFYFDYTADRIYVGDDPTGHKLEAAATEYAFEGSPQGAGQNVTLQNLIVEKYANQAQTGAIGHTNTATGWTITGCEVRWNHGAAIRTGSIKVLSSRLHHNGQAGIVGGGDRGTLIRDTEVDHNNTAGYQPDWEAGGIKLAGGSIVGVQVRHNNIHDNAGIGLWADGYNDQFVWDSNTVANNAWDGIKVEISYSGTVTNNIVTGNGFSNPHGVEGDGIMVYASGGTGLEIAYNTVRGNKHGIMLLGQDRGTGPQGTLTTQNVNVHDNVVTLGPGQRTGAVRYGGSTGLWTTDNNHFERNSYDLRTADTTPFEWEDASRTDAEWRAYGNDDTGTFSR